MPLEKIAGRLTEYQIGFTDGKFQIWRQPEKGKSLVPLVSPRDPAREATRMLAGFSLKKGLLAIVAGASQIPVLAELTRQKIQSGGEILLIEADEQLYSGLSAVFPDIFEHVTVITSATQNELVAFTEELDIEALTGYRIFSSPAVTGIDAAFYDHLVAEIKQRFSSRFSDLFTRLEFEPRWILNSLTNLSLVNKSRPTSSLFGQGRGHKALIVSTGPSLRQSIRWIKQNREKFFLACADSAWRVLHRQGITPDLVFSLDSQPFTLRHFLGLPAGTPNAYPLLACDFVSNPQVTLRWHGPLFLSFTAQYLGDRRVVTPGCDFLEEQNFFQSHNRAVPGDIQSGGSVATTLFDLLRQMEFSEIWFVGQDLAYTWHEIHTSGTHHTDIWTGKNTGRFSPLEQLNYAVTRKRHIRYEKSLRDKLIPGDYVLSLYRSWFADAASRVSIKLFNATYDGLPVEGMIRVDTTVNEKVSGENFPRNDWLKAILQRPRFEPDSGKINSFVEQCLANEFTGSEYSFMQRIGRKYDIRNRPGENAAEKKAKEKMFFRMQLRRAMQKVKALK